MLSINHLQTIIKSMIKSIKKCVTPTLEEANRRIINYENEIAYCDRIIESLENSNPLRELLPVKAFADVIKSMCSYTNHVNGIDQIIDSNKI